jgi:Domain of unknown function (DUF1854)
VEKSENSSNLNQLAVRWLEPSELVISWDSQATRLTVAVAGQDTIEDAQAALAFPITHPGKYIDIGKAKGESIGMIKSLESLKADSRDALRECIKTRYLIPRISHITDISETSSFVLCWHVDTDRGKTVFHTESTREAVRYQGPGRIRITDLTGNFYDLPDISQLDLTSRTVLDTYL